MAKITVYEKPTCTTCRNLAVLLKDNGIDYDKVNYYIEPLTAERLRSLIAKTGLRPYDVLRRNEAKAKDLGLNEDTDGEKLIELMVKYPELLQRPIVEVGAKAVLARPVDRALELIQP
ncbi:MAG TPA: ArsC/Spx/MgsR family protein [Pyrinomonadaceae bacterium]|nr:ArsC/Spx/MgsR family protein [Pyrinomonadaceae bacterium]